MSYAYVGCRTTRERNARGKGLKVYEISEATGEWKEIQCLETLPNPSYQAMDLEEKYLYSCLLYTSGKSCEYWTD